MSDIERQEEDYLYRVFGHYAVFERPNTKPEHWSPLQRVMRQIKELRGRRYWDRIDVPGGWHHELNPLMHESWFQLPAGQKEEHLLRRVDWSGVSEQTKEKIIARELRARDGEINARDEWHLYDQLKRVERITPNWDSLSSTAKLETLLRSKEVDWRPFPPDFQALALSHMIRREVKPTAEGFRIVGVFEAGTDWFPFGRENPGGGPRDAFEQSKRKGPRRPVFSKAEARESFRWAVAQPYWEAFVNQHKHVSDPAEVKQLKEIFRQRMRPLWQEFWQQAKKLNREQLSHFAIEKFGETRKALEPGQKAEAEQASKKEGLSLSDLRALAGQDQSSNKSRDRGMGR